jgi:hypothetical protein
MFITKTLIILEITVSTTNNQFYAVSLLKSMYYKIKDKKRNTVYGQITKFLNSEQFSLFHNANISNWNGKYDLRCFYWDTGSIRPTESIQRNG